jgi:hypothetical protein
MSLIYTSTAHLSADIFDSCNKNLTVSIAPLAQRSQKRNTVSLSVDNKINTYVSQQQRCRWAARISWSSHTTEHVSSTLHAKTAYSNLVLKTTARFSSMSSFSSLPSPTLDVVTGHHPISLPLQFHHHHIFLRLLLQFPSSLSTPLG